MSNDAPFLLVKVECPICKTINEFEVIKMGAYAEGGRDTDFCPQDIQWRFPRYQGYNPLVYFAATCGNCYYSRELTNEFREWKQDVNYRTYRLKAIKEKHLEMLSTADSVVKEMGELIDVANYPNMSAVLKLHLAVLDEVLAERPNALDLGRFYLRIGWVYREMAKGSDPGVSFLNGLVEEIHNKYAGVFTSIESVDASIDALARNVQSHFEAEQIPADIKSQMLAYRERYDGKIADLRTVQTGARNTMGELKALIDEYKTQLLGSEGGDGATQFGRYSSFQDFLLSAKRRWDGVVLDEQAALKKAIHYYCQAFASGRDIAPGNQQLQVSYLIAELSRRVGDFEQAKQYFSSTIKSGQEFIYQNRSDQSRTVLARKIMELAIEQGRTNLAALKPV